MNTPIEALRRIAEEAIEELERISNVKFKHFRDSEEFRAWARNRAQFVANRCRTALADLQEKK